MRTLALIALSALSACGSTEPPQASATATTEAWNVAPPSDDPDAPWDPRLLRMFPDVYLGTERVCDLVRVGQLQALEHRHGRRYPVPVSHRAAVRCRSPLGEGWADLVFTTDTAGLTSYARAGERIRIRALAPHGFERMPVVAFVAHIGPAPAARPARWAWAPVPSADALADRKGPGLCALAYVGPIEPTDPAQASEEDAQRAVVACRHPLGEDLLALVFSRQRQFSALRLRRGEVVPVEVSEHRTDSGLPLVRYTGP